MLLRPDGTVAAWGHYEQFEIPAGLSGVAAQQVRHRTAGVAGGQHDGLR